MHSAPKHAACTAPRLWVILQHSWRKRWSKDDEELHVKPWRMQKPLAAVAATMPTQISFRRKVELWPHAATATLGRCTVRLNYHYESRASAELMVWHKAESCGLAFSRCSRASSAATEANRPLPRHTPWRYWILPRDRVPLRHRNDVRERGWIAMEMEAAGSCTLVCSRL